jgi:hypothetical protein
MITINEAGRRINAALNELSIRVAEAEKEGLSADDLWYRIIRERTERTVFAALTAVGCETLADFACELAAEARHDEAFNSNWTPMRGAVTDGVKTPRSAAAFVEGE